jgi:hypothetical protein
VRCPCGTAPRCALGGLNFAVYGGGVGYGGVSSVTHAAVRACRPRLRVRSHPVAAAQNTIRTMYRVGELAGGGSRPGARRSRLFLSDDPTPVRKGATPRPRASLPPSPCPPAPPRVRPSGWHPCEEGQLGGLCLVEDRGQGVVREGGAGAGVLRGFAPVHTPPPSKQDCIPTVRDPPVAQCARFAFAHVVNAGVCLSEPSRAVPCRAVPCRRGVVRRHTRVGSRFVGAARCILRTSPHPIPPPP